MRGEEGKEKETKDKTQVGGEERKRRSREGQIKKR